MIAPKRDEMVHELTGCGTSQKGAEFFLTRVTTEHCIQFVHLLNGRQVLRRGLGCESTMDKQRRIIDNGRNRSLFQPITQDCARPVRVEIRALVQL
jgi:hypothetical protein